VAVLLRPLALLFLVGASSAVAQAPLPYELRLGANWLWNATGSATFSGATPAVPATGSTHTAAMGSQLGFMHPQVWGAEAEALIGIGRLWTVGALGAFGLGSGPDASPQNPALQTALNPGSFQEWKAGLAAGARGKLGTGPLRLEAELRGGLREQSFPIAPPGVPMSCNGPCYYSLSRLSWFLQPQVRLAVEVDRDFNIGLFVATDVAPSPFHQVSLGLDFALQGAGF
jgi:hypothetical protein